MAKLTSEEKQELRKIYSMSHEEMASLWRFAPSGHPYFDNRLPYYRHFERRFLKNFGGFTPEISKRIGR